MEKPYDHEDDRCPECDEVMDPDIEHECNPPDEDDYFPAGDYE